MKKKPQFKSAKHAKESRENKVRWALILKDNDVEVFKKRFKQVFKPIQATDAEQKLKFQFSLGRVPERSKQQVKFVEADRTKPVYTGEMAVREAEAQKEIERKKQRVAPVANKMGYQYISNPDDFKTMGRKT